MSRMSLFVGAGALLLTLGLVGQATAASNTKSKNLNKNVSYDTACVQSAIAKRDEAISVALDVNHETLKAAITMRTKAMQDAAALTTGRKAAHKVARDAWKASAKASIKTLKASRDTAWTTYATDLTACGATSKDDSSSKNIDNVLFSSSSSSAK